MNNVRFRAKSSWSDFNPPVPCAGPIPGGLQVGKSLTIEGVIKKNADRFNINLTTGPFKDYPSTEDCPIGFQVSVRLIEKVIVRNTFLKGRGWQSEKRDGKIPVEKGEKIVLISCESTNYKPVPCAGPIPGGLQVGKSLTIEGIIKENADRFNINLTTGPFKDYPSTEDCPIGFQVSVRLIEKTIVRNTFLKGRGWQTEKRDGEIPVEKGQKIVLVISCEPTHYKVTINGNEFCTYPYIIPYQEIAVFHIWGDLIATKVTWEEEKLDTNLVHRNDYSYATNSSTVSPV